jgi:hypothetical protein
MNNKEMLNDLYEAINEDNLKRVEYLISQGVNVDKSIEGQELPLYLAIRLNNAPMCTKIIESLKDKVKGKEYDHENIFKHILIHSKEGNLEGVLDRFYNLKNLKTPLLEIIYRLTRNLQNYDKHLVNLYQENNKPKTISSRTQFI